MRGSCRYCLISLVYSSSCFCVAGAAATASTALARTAILTFIELSSEEAILPRDAAWPDRPEVRAVHRLERRHERDDVRRIPVEAIPVGCVRNIGTVADDHDVWREHGDRRRGRLAAAALEHRHHDRVADALLLQRDELVRVQI